MYLNVNNIVFIILSYQWLTIPTGAAENNEKTSDTKNNEDLNDCYIPIPDKNDLERPIPYKTHHTTYNSNVDVGPHGHLHLKHNDIFKMECSAGRQLTIGKNLNKIFVKCINKESVLYNQVLYECQDIKCNEVILKRSSVNITDTRTSYEMGLELSDPGVEDCYVMVPDPDYNFMPIPFLANSSSPAIIHPNAYGFFNIKVNDVLKLSCAGNAFITPVKGTDEVTLKCIGGTFFEFNGLRYEFDSFKCQLMPRPTMVVTKERCQVEGNKIMEVGFQTNHVFLVLYKICYDVIRNNPLYAWYHTNSPQPKLRQTSHAKPDYFSTNTYGKIDVNKAYWNQDITLDKILKSRKRAEEIIIRGDKRYVTKVHLIAKSEYYYAFEKHATYYYENTTPQWYRYGKGFWRDMERAFRRYLSIQHSRHLVVSGSFMTSTIPDKRGIPHPFFLTLTRQMPVPQYLWKMNYDVLNQTGIVWVGLNNPTTRLNETRHICEPIPCPTKMQRKTYNPKLMYCCSKDGFEKEHGRIDSVVYNEFNVVKPMDL